MRGVPDTLGGRVVLLLALALILANAVALVLLTSEQRSAQRREVENRQIERVAALVSAMEAVEPRARIGIARRASGREARVRVGPIPTVTDTSNDRMALEIATRLSDALEGREVFVALGVERGDDAREDRRRGREVSVTIPLRSSGVAQQYLNVTGRSPLADRVRLAGEAFVTILALSLFAVLAVAILIARQMTRPLAALSRAARAAGRGDRSVRLPEAGPREVREAAKAFNAMQAEIAAFDAERVRMIAAVGHDLRTPMTGLRIRAEMVEDEAQREAMIKTLDEMTVMADGLVAYAREGQDAEAMRPLDLTALVREVAEERGIPVSAPGGITVRGRPVALKRALGNLVENAVRYGEAPRIAVERDGPTARVAVEDRGPGLPPEMLERVFQPFARGDTSRSRDTGGAGLGLSIARAIIVAHGGEIMLENREGGGLIATATLPAPS